MPIAVTKIVIVQQEHALPISDTLSITVEHSRRPLSASASLRIIYDTPYKSTHDHHHLRWGVSKLGGGKAVLNLGLYRRVVRVVYFVTIYHLFQRSPN